MNKNKEARLFAAVKFYADTKHVVVPVEKIENFSLKESYPTSYMIKRKNKVTGEDGAEPAQILAVSENYDELNHNSRRYKYKILRVSDALDELAKQSPNDGEDKSSERDEDDDGQKYNDDSDKGKDESLRNDEELHDTGDDVDSAEDNKEAPEGEHERENKKGRRSECKKSTNPKASRKEKKLLSTAETSDIDNDYYKLMLEKKLETLKADSELKFSKNTDKGKDKKHELKIYQLERELSIVRNDLESKSNELAIKEAENAELIGKITKLTDKINIKKKKILKRDNQIKILQEQLSKYEFLSENGRQYDSAINKIDNRSPPIGLDDKCCSFNENHENIRDFNPLLINIDNQLSPVPLEGDNIHVVDSRTSTPIPHKYRRQGLQCPDSPEMRKAGNYKKIRMEYEGDTNSEELDGNQESEPSTVNKKSTIFKKLKTCGYDSDNYIKSADYNKKLENFFRWEKSDGNKPVSMFHLCYGVSILYSDWKECKKQHSPSMFVRKLSEVLWGGKLINRAFIAHRVFTSSSKVQAFTPRKLAVLQKSYHQYLKTKLYLEKEKLGKMSLKEKIALLQEWRSFLTSKVNTIRTTSKRSNLEKSEKSNNNSADEIDINVSDI